MKMKFYAPILFVVCFGLLCSSCQKEETELVDETNNEETITANSQLAAMLISASQNNGSVDDLIDGSSCTSVELPVAVYANNQPLTIQNLDDLQLIQTIFDEFPDDTDILEIVFPIRVIYEDYSEEEIENIGEMASIVANCQNFIEDTYICVDFVYPISCFIYNLESEQTGMVTLQSDLEWFDYLTYLTNDILIAIDYQMTVLVNGDTFQINNNQDLTDVFAQTECDTGGGSTIDPEVNTLRTIMKNGTWYVSQFLDDGEDETSNFTGYDFTFLESVTVYATNGSGIVYGVWIVSLDSGELNFEFDMDSPINGADNDAYDVLEYDYDQITFVTRDSDGIIEDTLIFEKN